MFMWQCCKCFGLKPEIVEPTNERWSHAAKSNVYEGESVSSANGAEKILKEYVLDLGAMYDIRFQVDKRYQQVGYHAHIFCIS